VSADREGRRTIWLALAITLLALALRASFLAGAQVEAPVRGDIVEYWAYAWNLVHHGVFSLAPASASVPAPDAWRGPFYPFFLAACLRLAHGDMDRAIAIAQWLQIGVGTLLVPLTIGLGRQWLSRNAALLAGLGVALWPHLVVFAGTLLSETWFAFFLLLAAWLTAIAQARDDSRLAIAAGLAAGLGALVNPLLLLFPPVLALLLAWRGQRRVALAYLGAFVLLAGAWAARGATLPPDAGTAARARTNLVQGSYPLLHAAMNDRYDNEIAAAYYDEIEREAAAMNADPRAGYARFGERLRAEPGTYLRWYLLQKPWLLWDWSVRVGWGDVYFLETHRSPFERVPVLRVLHDTVRALNPLVFALALAAALWSLACLARLRAATPAELARLQVGLLCCYVTAVHMVLQAEPRYAVAYRPLEILLAVSACALAAAAWTRRREARA
jgi:hypothetical protein